MSSAMSLPLSPPPSRSSSQISVSRKPAVYNPNERSITPVSPAPSPSPARKPKPTLTLNPSALPCSTATATTFAAPTPSSAPSSTLRSFFSPCSDSEDDDDDDDDDEDGCEEGTPIKSARPRGHFQRLWASHDPPSMPPSGPPPALPRRLSTPLSSTFGWHSNPSPSPSKPYHFSSPAPGTPAHHHHRPSRLPAYSMHPPAAPEAPPTGVFPPPSPWSDGIMSYANSPTIPTPPPSDPLLQGLHALLTGRLHALCAVLAAPPPPDLAAARAERDRLLVKTQKAYFRRTPQEAVVELHAELREREERVRALESALVRGFVGALDVFAEGVREGCRGFVGEEGDAEVIEVELGDGGDNEEEEEEEEEIYTTAREWPEDEIPSPKLHAAPNAERRFTWTPSSFEDEDEDDEEEEEEEDMYEGDYYADPTADPSFASLPPLAPDEELYLSEYSLSPSNSSCAPSPVVGVGCACEGQCDCWGSFLPPSPALSSSSQRMMGGRKSAVEHWEKRWGENVVVVQGVEMRMI